MDAQNSKRVWINAAQDAKGFFKLDVTAEVEYVDGADPVDTAAVMLTRTIEKARKEIEVSGMKWLADPVAATKPE